MLLTTSYKEHMKFIHLSDLHIGKRVNEFSMIEDQKYILRQVIELVQKENRIAFLLQEISMISRFRLPRQCRYLMLS